MADIDDIAILADIAYIMADIDDIAIMADIADIVI